jgi:hypothetical protein
MARRRLLSDHLISLFIGDLGRIRPHSRRSGVVLTRDYAAAVMYEIDARDQDADLTLTYENTRTRVLLRARRITYGRRWYFVGTRGDLGTRLYYLPGIKWDTRRSAGIVPKSVYLRGDERKRHVLALVTAELEEIIRRSRIQQRQLRLEARRAKLLHELGMAP